MMLPIKIRRDDMEMIYAALLLHSLGKKIDEAGVQKVMEAAGAQVEHSQIKALVAKLKSVDINEAIKGASLVQTVAASSEKSKEEKKEAKKEEKTEEKAEEAAAGLSALFG
jgi:large subunit ribosomal protein L12